MRVQYQICEECAMDISDHAIYAVLMRMALKHNIKYILTGNNFKTESIMPKSWAYGHIDWKYIKNIHKMFGRKRLDSFPRYSLKRLFYVCAIKGVKFVSIFNYVDYDRNQAIDISGSEFENIMNSEPKNFLNYKNNYKLIMLVRQGIHFLRSKGILHK